jgi:apolipoprotein N-acyltransferase
MDISGAAALSFAVATVSAAIAAFREDIFPKVQKVALAVAFAALGFLLLVVDKLALVK